jgi:quinoprotein relay system zinc metallohydrolase 2
MRQGIQEDASTANRGHIANLGFIVGEFRVAVIDAGGSLAEGQALLQALRKVTQLPIGYLILTHMHPDHALGAGAFAGEEVQVVGHENLADALVRRQGFYLDAARERLGAYAEGTSLVMPGSVVEVGRVRHLDLGGRVLELRAHPTAHTNNDLSLLDVATGTLWLSDLLFVGRIPVVDGSLRGWLQVMDELEGVEAERAVPGHGPARQDWKVAIEDQRRYLEALAEGVRKEIRDGGNIARAVETVGGEERDRWLLFDDYHGRNVTTAFVELEWE